MATFKAGGREWVVEINPWQMRRVREANIGVELKSFADNAWKLLFETVADTEKFVDLLYVLCQPQIEAASVSMEDFLKGLAGDPYEDAVHALLKAFADFYPRQNRALLLALVNKATEVQNLSAANTMAKIDQTTAAEVLSILKDSAGSTPVSSESIPTA